MWADVLRTVLVIVHVGVTAAWLGAMLYNLVFLQPLLRQFFADPDEREDFATVLAAGARRKVLGLAAILALSGVGLTVIELAEAGSPSTAWIGLVSVKAVLLAAAIMLFVYVSWRLWPARLLAHMSGSAALPRIQRRFRLVAVVLTAVVALGLVAGSAAEAVR